MHLFLTNTKHKDVHCKFVKGVWQGFCMGYGVPFIGKD